LFFLENSAQSGGTAVENAEKMAIFVKNSMQKTFSNVMVSLKEIKK